ncbi:hypothetical protein RHS01_03708 [Rhizoctonia solani]|uniref:Succinate dehydrogenase assembly factor 4, mitochondrial n=1 Tax=Rhizoctonia solani TaxID=456999 RepID=A0A8H7IGJ9_9AGAM|nr:hypothetical protein RHS01_03708 [Rhizoctonia solani]
MQVFTQLRNVPKCSMSLHRGLPHFQREQREFEELVRNAQAPAASATVNQGEELHPDARRPIAPGFIGEVNPKTGERGGPKQEPVPKGRNDWSYGGELPTFNH